MHYVLAIQITVQKFGNNRLVKYVHGFVSELIGREIYDYSNRKSWRIENLSLLWALTKPIKFYSEG